MFRRAECLLACLHVALVSDLTRPVVKNILCTSLHHYLSHVPFAHSTILFSSSKPMDTQKGCIVSDAKLQSVSKLQWQKQCCGSTHTQRRRPHNKTHVQHDLARRKLHWASPTNDMDYKTNLKICSARVFTMYIRSSSCKASHNLFGVCNL